MGMIEATAMRDGDWWVVEFVSQAGQRFTQARRLDQIPAMVADICAMDGIEVGPVEIHVVDNEAQVPPDHRI